MPKPTPIATVADDAHGNYLAALAAIRLRDLLTAERWAEPEEGFDLILAASLARLDAREVG